ncbi:MAG: hypothetical protein KatS3mg105_0111 [Gemmatales bacterium]|nr:MAG: hypothetical protein KatS3mg105_0111 [Gemmatales bacterium]
MVPDYQRIPNRLRKSCSPQSCSLLKRISGTDASSDMAAPLKLDAHLSFSIMNNAFSIGKKNRQSNAFEFTLLRKPPSYRAFPWAERESKYQLQNRKTGARSTAPASSKPLAGGLRTSWPVGTTHKATRATCVENQISTRNSQSPAGIQQPLDQIGGPQSRPISLTNRCTTGTTVSKLVKKWNR